MSTDFPFAESSGRVGNVDGWAFVCQTRVGVRNGGGPVMLMELLDACSEGICPSKCFSKCLGLD